MDRPSSWRCASPWPVILRSKAANSRAAIRQGYGLEASAGFAPASVFVVAGAAGASDFVDEPAGGTSAVAPVVGEVSPSLPAGVSADLVALGSRPPSPVLLMGVSF